LAIGVVVILIVAYVFGCLLFVGLRIMEHREVKRLSSADRLAAFVIKRAIAMTISDADSVSLKSQRELEKLQMQIEKLRTDIHNAKGRLRLERFKVWAAIFGPLVTGLTVWRPSMLLLSIFLQNPIPTKTRTGDRRSM
jgi:hypothetical protein